MPYEVNLTGPARRNLHAIAPRVLGPIMEFIDGALANNPYRVGKPLVGELVAGQFTAHRGAYRVIYRIDDDSQVVHVIRVQHRSDVYR